VVVDFVLVDEGEVERDGDAPNRDVKSADLRSTRRGAGEGLRVGWDVACPVEKSDSTVLGACLDRGFRVRSFFDRVAFLPALSEALVRVWSFLSFLWGPDFGFAFQFAFLLGPGLGLLTAIRRSLNASPVDSNSSSPNQERPGLKDRDCEG